MDLPTGAAGRRYRLGALGASLAFALGAAVASAAGVEMLVTLLRALAAVAFLAWAVLFVRRWVE